MTGSDCILDTSVPACWTAWRRFRRGKQASVAIDHFEYALESELIRLSDNLKTGTYRHGLYHHFETTDTKRRRIAVASIRDRVVHRLLYEYLVPRFDRTFLYDVWSCRAGKGLIGAIERTQTLLWRFRHGWVWRADVAKFFDHVDHSVLKRLIRRRITDVKSLGLIDQVIDSYPASPDSREGESRRPSATLGSDW